MNSVEQKNEFNPSGVGLKNGNFIGLPFTLNSARLVLLPVPWDVTVSYGEGTALGPQAILDASAQLDLLDPDVEDAWKLGIFMQPFAKEILNKRNVLRSKATSYIDFLEQGGNAGEDEEMEKTLSEINFECNNMVDYVFKHSKMLMDAGKLVGVVGGDHSVPLGYLRALSEKYNSFGILQFDAHLDLRKGYEGFDFSHASIFNNALQEKSVSKLVQVGIRDYCDEEMELVKINEERIVVFFDQKLKENKFDGKAWNAQCEEIVNQLPELVYISFDIDGLDPKLCPNTGTPVPGGLEFSEAIFLLKKVVESGRKIIGFDVCETGNNEWDANVAARIIYKLCNLTGRSNGLI
ncbi:agmatinase [Mariniphaga anaerophila]|uniref:Agmatinase n=1 Tax=Mariniphaga anaerophila TaxID=1484053 RepID=A0A1M4XSH4_9BACT|nr:agmatinase family protein [Mariniphaga anaerophila]SHE96398.1 agmatinase [Mariniphaga anaerophila]